MATLDPQRLQALRDHPASQALVDIAAGRPCHVVGGAVRDVLLGREWHDVDLLVAGGGAHLARQLADRLSGRLVDLGRGEFASWRIVVDGHAYDLWDRGEESLEAELRRRDLTLNAIAYAIPEGELIDPCGGLADLRAGLLVATAETSFELDPLRILRLVRHRTELPGFRIEEATLRLARRSAPAIERVAAERVREECERILGGKQPWTAHRPLVETDLYPRLWNGAGQPSAAAEGGARRLDLDEAFPRLRQRLDRLAPATASTRDWAGLAVDAVLVAELDSPAAAMEHLRGRAFRTRPWLRRLERIVRWRPIPESEADQRRFLHDLGEDWRAALLATGVLAELTGTAASWVVASESVHQLAARAGEVIFHPPALLDGEDVMALLGIDPGPAVGRALDALRAAQVQGTVTTSEEAEAFVRQLSKRSDLPSV